RSGYCRGIDTGHLPRASAGHTFWPPPKEPPHRNQTTPVPGRRRPANTQTEQGHIGTWGTPGETRMDGINPVRVAKPHPAGNRIRRGLYRALRLLLRPLRVGPADTPAGSAAIAPSSMLR